MRAVDVILIVAAVLVAAGAYAAGRRQGENSVTGHLVTARAHCRAAEECARYLDLRIQALTAQRDAAQEDDPATLASQLWSLRTLTRDCLYTLDAPPAQPGPLNVGIRLPPLDITPLATPALTTSATGHGAATPADHLREDLRALLRDFEAAPDTGTNPYAGRGTSALKAELHAAATRLDRAVARYLTAAAT
jgi:hypothetical protein